MLATNVPKIAGRLSSNTLQSARNMSVISGPPTVKISTAEKFAHGIAIAVGCFTIPTWVLVNVKHYRTRAA